MGSKSTEQIVDSVMHADISNNGSHKSSRFELTISTNGGSANSQWLNLVNSKVDVAIYLRSHWDDRSSVLFNGLADNIAFDPLNGTARIVGRDYSSVLISSTYQSSYCNQTASEIASSIATRHGFVPNISPTSTMVGSYQGDGYNQLLLNAHSYMTSEWDLLKYVASIEGFQLFVEGTTLVFAPAEALSSGTKLIGTKDVIAMSFHLVCPTSAQIALTAKSWNSWLSQALIHTDDQPTVQASLDMPGLNADPGTEVVMIKPNLSSQGR